MRSLVQCPMAASSAVQRSTVSCRVSSAYPQVVFIEANAVQSQRPSAASEWRQLREVVGSVLGTIEPVRVEAEIVKRTTSVTTVSR